MLRFCSALFAAFVVVFPGVALAASGGAFCALSNPFALVDTLGGVPSACTVARGAVSIDADYLQNASRVGGTALAAYPLVRLRSGITKRLDVEIDVPSQIAESRAGGGGLYPMTRFGYGLGYSLVASSASAIALLAQVLPPTSRFAPTQTQSKYAVGLTSSFTVAPRLTLGVVAGGTSSGTVGFQRVLPSLAVNGGYAASNNTQFSVDLGSRISSRRSVAQSFGDASINQRLRRNLLFSVGVGTSFNPVGNAKSHYLASGFNVRI